MIDPFPPPVSLRSRRAVAANIVIVLLAFISLPTQAQPRRPDPTEFFTTPAAVAPATQAELIFHNPPPGKPIALWTSFGAQVTFTSADPIRARITLPADAPVGIGAIRLATSAGLSDPHLLLIDDLPTRPRKPGNTSAQAAHLIEPQSSIEAPFEPLTSHFYRFRADKHQRIAFEVVAQRTGSAFDPHVRLLDAAGRELAAIDDTPGLGADLRFAHTFNEPGEYLLEIRDAEYGGNPAARGYHLRLGDFPAVTTAFPLGAKRGLPTNFTFEGPGGGRVGPLQLTPPLTSPHALLAVRVSGGRSAALVSFIPTDRPDVLGGGSNFSRQTAERIEAPGAVSGRFNPTGPRHFYQLSAKKGDRFAVRARTRSLGSACDLVLEATTADGQRLADSKPAAADEGTLEFQATSDGQFFITCRELAAQAGPAVVYRLEIDRDPPTFTLSVAANKLEATAGKPLKIKLKPERKGYEGPIKLTLTGDAAPFKLKNDLITGNKKEVELELTIPPETPTDRLLTFTITGQPENTSQQVTATTTTLLKATFPRLLHPPDNLDGQIALIIRKPQAEVGQ